MSDVQEQSEVIDQNLLYLNMELLKFIKDEGMPNALRYSSLYILGICINSKKHCYYASHSNTSESLGLSVSTVRRALSWMLDAGWVVLDNFRPGITRRYLLVPGFHEMVFNKHSKKEDRKEQSVELECRLKPGFRMETDDELSLRVGAFYKMAPKDRKGQKVPTRKVVKIVDEDELAEHMRNQRKVKHAGKKSKRKKLRLIRNTDMKMQNETHTSGAKDTSATAAFPRKKKRRDFLESSVIDIKKQYANSSCADRGGKFGKLPESIQDKIIAAAKSNTPDTKSVYYELAKDCGMPVHKALK